MNKEQLELLDDAYRNYVNKVKLSIDKATEDGILKNDNSEGYSYLSKETFISRVKTDKKFSKKWRFKIKEKELDLNDRRKMVTQEMFNQIYSGGGPDSLSNSEIDQWNIPTKLVKITYTKTVESYE